jgi:hypothetical protein
MNISTDCITVRLAQLREEWEVMATIEGTELEKAEANFLLLLMDVCQKLELTDQQLNSVIGFQYLNMVTATANLVTQIDTNTEPA